MAKAAKGGPRPPGRQAGGETGGPSVPDARRPAGGEGRGRSGTDPQAGLIGRAAEMGALDRALVVPEPRLITLTGPPGVGKTRLALSAAAAAEERFPDGTAFVDLALVDTTRRAALEMARVFGVGRAAGRAMEERLGRWLAPRSLLLVADSCERVPGVGGLLATLLARCPRLRVLATSRDRLRVAVEREAAVPPLAVPGRADLADLTKLAATPAVALLVERTRAVRPGFTLDPGNAGAVAEICVRLDGLPLAIEVAAARLAQFEPAELAFRLRSRRVLLDAEFPDAPVRHRTLRAAIGWSHDLLTDAERTIFRRASVFVGPWTLAAAEQVCAGPGLDVVAATTSLVDKNLVRGIARPDGAAGFDMLDSLREYAEEQLRAHGEADVTSSRHAAYFAGLATYAEAGFGTRDEAMWFDWVGHEQGNLRAALDHCLDRGDTATALPLAAATGWYWYTRGYLGEGQAGLDRVLDAVARGGGQPPEDVLTGPLLVAGILAWSRGDLARADDLLRRTLALSERAGDPRRSAVAYAFLGHVARESGRYDDAAAAHRHAEALHQQRGNARGAMWTRHDLGLLALELGRLDEAADLLGEARSWFAGRDDSWAQAWASLGLGMVALRRDDADVAAPLLVEALDRYDEVGDGRGVGQSLEALAEVACERAAFESAVRLLSAAETLRQALDAPLAGPGRTARDRVRRRVEGALGPTAAERAYLAGQTMPPAAAALLGRGVAASTGRTRRSTATPLTGRERQVASLIATGRTNRQIARTLGIAEKTAEVHVSHIMGKLDARSRAEVAAYAVSAGLHPVPDPVA